MGWLANAFDKASELAEDAKDAICEAPEKVAEVAKDTIEDAEEITERIWNKLLGD